MSIDAINNSSILPVQQGFLPKKSSPLGTSYSASTLAPAPMPDPYSLPLPPIPQSADCPEFIAIEDAYFLLSEAKKNLEQNSISLFLETLDRLSLSLQKEILPSLNINLEEDEQDKKNTLSRLSFILATVEICRLDVHSLLSKLSHEDFEDYLKNKCNHFYRTLTREGFKFDASFHIESSYNFYDEIHNDTWPDIFRNFKDTEMKRLGLSMELPPSLFQTKLTFSSDSISTFFVKILHFFKKLNRIQINKKNCIQNINIYKNILHKNFEEATIKDVFLELPSFAQTYIGKDLIENNKLLKLKERTLCLLGTLQFLQLDLRKLHATFFNMNNHDDLMNYLKKENLSFLIDAFNLLRFGNSIQCLSFSNFYNIIKSEPLLFFDDLSNLQENLSTHWKLENSHADVSHSFSTPFSSEQIKNCISSLDQLKYYLKHQQFFNFTNELKRLPSSIKNLSAHGMYHTRDINLATFIKNKKNYLETILCTIAVLEVGTLDLLWYRCRALTNHPQLKLLFMKALKQQAPRFWARQDRPIDFGEKLGTLNVSSFYDKMKEPSENVALLFREYAQSFLNPEDSEEIF